VKNKTFNTKKIGNLLMIISNALIDNRDISEIELKNFLFDFIESDKFKKDIDKINTVDEIKNIQNKLSLFNTEELREFIMINYQFNIPYRISKNNLRALSIGAILLNYEINLDFAIKKWEENRKELNKIIIYDIEKEYLEKILNDKQYFPDAYSIYYYFNKKYHIKLNISQKRQEMIYNILEKLYYKPNNIKKIGYWGIKEKNGD